MNEGANPLLLYIICTRWQSFGVPIWSPHINRSVIRENVKFQFLIPVETTYGFKDEISWTAHLSFRIVICIPSSCPSFCTRRWCLLFPWRWPWWLSSGARQTWKLENIIVWAYLGPVLTQQLCISSLIWFVRWVSI